ncbi:MAG: hypothetical protein ACX94C_04755 [Phycisphaerales bacterium]
MSITNGFIISLSQTHLSVLSVRRGRVHQAETTRLDPREWNEQLADGLMRLDQPLRQLLSRFSSSPRNAVTLIYQSPTLTTQITNFEQGGAVARETARAKIREVAGFDASVCVCELGRSSTSAGKSMMLAYTDRDETLRAFYAWLNRCGVRVSGMIPSSVLAVTIAADQASREDGTGAVFYLDKHCSVIGHADEKGQLTLVRPADIGFETLTDSYKQVLLEHAASEGEEENGQNLDAEAQACLFEYGIPFQMQQRGEIELRSSVLPRMAPALQRIGIDVKQTIRFGMEDPKELTRLTISGPGAAIPSITKAIGEHLELQVSLVSGSDEYNPACAGASGSTEAMFIRMQSQVPAILPRIADEERSRSRFKKSIAAGVALASLAMGGQYAYSTHQMQTIADGLRTQEGRTSRVASYEESREHVQLTQSMLAEMAKQVTTYSGDRPRWGDALAYLSTLSGESVRIQEMRGELEGDQPMLILSGYSIAAQDQSPEVVLDSFVEALNEAEFVTGVELGATTRIELASYEDTSEQEPEWGSQFSLRIMLGSTESPYNAIAGVQTEGEWTQP